MATNGYNHGGTIVQRQLVGDRQLERNLQQLIPTTDKQTTKKAKE